MDTKKLSDALTSLEPEAKNFFDVAFAEVNENPISHWQREEQGRNAYWDNLSPDTRRLSQQTQENLLKVISLIIPMIKSSPLLNESDEKDVGRCVKRMRAALKLRNYRSWEIEVLHDEGTVLGVSPPGQAEDECSSPDEARKIFVECLEQLEGIAELLKIAPVNMADGLPAKNPNLSQNYRPNTAFIMMPINASDPENEDIYTAYKDCFTRFGVVATRADEIEHEGVITDRIITEIKTSEFLVGDLTNERPSVYYEIGYAHALNRRVILYRKHGTPIHFDLAAFNCPMYKNITELKKMLTKRIEEITNRKLGDG